MDFPLSQLFGMNNSAPGVDTPQVDTAETVQISSLALLKMLKHGRAGVPLEVMGLMLGEFVDDYTVKVIDVFAMPQSGTGMFKFIQCHGIICNLFIRMEVKFNNLKFLISN